MDPPGRLRLRPVLEPRGVQSWFNLLVPLGVLLCWYYQSKFLSFDASRTDLADARPSNEKGTSPSRNRTDVPPFSSTTSGRRRPECVSAALVIYGVPKSFPYIYRGYTKNIVERNPHVCFEVHMHMYDDLHRTPFSNGRNGEKNVTLESPEDVREVLKAGGDGVPTRLVTSSQADFDARELSWMDESLTRQFHKLTVPSLKNIFRQGNSMKEAYASASLSYTLRPGPQQRHGQGMYVFARSDTLLVSPVEIPPDGVEDWEMFVPGWHQFGGDNDRFAVAGPAAAGVFTAAKLDVFREMMLRPNETVRAMERENRTGWGGWKGGKERHAFWDGRLRNPEKMLRMWLDANDGVVVVRRMGGDWAHVLRVRSGGVLNGLELMEFKMKEKNVRDVVL